MLAIFSIALLLSTVVAQDGQAAIQDSPSGTYAPVKVNCPSPALSVRRTTAQIPINPREAAYVQRKTQNSAEAWTQYLSNVGLAGLDIPAFVAGTQAGIPGVDMPNIATICSGGGERAMLACGGILAGLDSRNSSAVAAKVGGVVQLATYIAGLSGGSWITGSWALAGYPMFEQLRDQVWNLRESGGQADPVDVTDVGAKATAGFPVSFNDLFGRQLSDSLTNSTVNGTVGGGATTSFHSIQSVRPFAESRAPFPIIIALNRVEGQINVTVTSPIVEFTPYEFGSFDPTLAPGAFIDIEYLGTEFFDGAPAAGEGTCVLGFDNGAFCMAASGQFFGAAAQLALGIANLPETPVTPMLETLLGAVPDNQAIDARIPSPFNGINPETFVSSGQAELFLADAGLSGENVPFTPVLHKERNVDVILAIDASADTDNFPDGREPRQTYIKSLLPGYAGNFPMPFFPINESFVAQGLHQRISFFGSVCTGVVPETPLIVYVPNHNIVAATNTSTFTPSYPKQQQIDFFNNGAAISSQENSATWPICLACALLDSQIIRNGGVRSAECDACFTEYCYLGTSDTNDR